MSDICNGYSISGNLAEKVGRKYEVYGADGAVLHTTDSKRKALDYAESLPAGDFEPEPVEESVSESEPEE